MSLDNKERLTIVSRETVNGRTIYLCQCTCGNTIKVDSRNFKRTHSCGCYRREFLSNIATTHGYRHTRLYRIWSGMLYRCNNKNSPKYHIYGERGISVSEQWNKFENFLFDMLDSYVEHCSIHGVSNTTIDRKDTNLGYSKENCRWATAKEQANNTRRNRMIEYNGKSQSLAKWAEELKIGYGALKYRLRSGRTFEEAIKCR